MTKNLTLSKALRAEGYDLIDVTKAPRGRSRIRVTLLVGKYRFDYPSPVKLTKLEQDDISAIVKEFFPEAELRWADSWVRMYTLDTTKGARLPIGMSSTALHRRDRRRYDSWRRRIISATGS